MVDSQQYIQRQNAVLAESTQGQGMSRRHLLRSGLLAAGGTVLAACLPETSVAVASPLKPVEVRPVGPAVRLDGGGGNGEAPKALALPTADEVQKYGVAGNWAECFPWVQEKSGGIVDLEFMRREHTGRFVHGSEYLSDGELRVFHSGDLEINGVHRRADRNELALGFVQGRGGYAYRSEGGWSGFARTDGKDLSPDSFRALQARRLQEVIDYKPDVSGVYLMEFDGRDGDIDVTTKRLDRYDMERLIGSTPDICPK